MEKMVNSSKIDPSFWKNKKVFVTGHTGFKGSWLTIWLKDLGAKVIGFSLEPKNKENLFDIANVKEGIESQIGDIRDNDLITSSISEFNPDILIHMAAQPLVRYSYLNPLETYETNVIGTLNVLEGARKCNNLKSIVIITTDKCYENNEWDWGYRENEPMGGHDPYSSSKGCCELLVSSYRNSFFNDENSPNIASVRAGNVIGGGDWSEDRLIPDILESFQNKKEVIIRNPLSVRPWQHVLEPLSAYLILAEKLYNNKQFNGAWNIGPYEKDCKSVEWILNSMINLWGKDATWKLDDNANPHEANLLKLDISKAINKLNWRPKWSLDYTLETIVNWHKKWIDGEDMNNECLNQIKNYTNND